MKRKMIALTAFMAVTLAGCGQIDEPLSTTNSNNQAATQIEVQTEKKTDAPAESTTNPQLNLNTTHFFPQKRCEHIKM